MRSNFLMQNDRMVVKVISKFEVTVITILTKFHMVK